MVGLDARKGKILKAIVRDYVDTAEPVGSEWLASRHDFGCKSATLRNEMAEMADLGYLVQPHTSAGRIPSRLGYRYYVDKLMQYLLEAEQSDVIYSREGYPDARDIIQHSCRMLSAATRYPSVASSPTGNAISIRRVFFSRASQRHILAVILFSTRQVENFAIETTLAATDDELSNLAGKLSDYVADRELASVTADFRANIAIHSAVTGLPETMITALCEMFDKQVNHEVYLEGANHILRQREFQDLMRLEQVLSALEQRQLLFKVFQRARLVSSDVVVLIGDELPAQEMFDCSVVTSPYHIHGRESGYIGVVGPTRMRYDQAVSAVSYMAKNLSQWLTQACIN